MPAPDQPEEEHRRTKSAREPPHPRRSSRAPDRGGCSWRIRDRWVCSKKHAAPPVIPAGPPKILSVSGARLRLRLEAPRRLLAAASGGGNGGAPRHIAPGRLVRLRPVDRLAPNDLVDLVARQGLVFEEGLREPVQLVQVLGQDCPRFLLARFHHAAGLLIDQAGSLIRDVLP